jgi:hypothetical protein
LAVDLTYPSHYRPSSTADLVRIGGPFDGGYVIPARVLRDCSGLLSFGLSDDCTFEVDFAHRAACPVVCFDHTVDGKFWLTRIAANIVKGFARRQPEHFLYPKRWFAYRRLFGNGRHRHIRQAIGYGVADTVTFPQAKAMAGFEHRYFLKIDIEGWEYRILDDIVADAGNLSGLVIEFHDVDLHEERIRTFLTAISRQMLLVHFHPNTAMRLGPESTSLVIELSFLNRALLGADERPQERPLPLTGIDAPNHRDSVDASVRFG